LEGIFDCNGVIELSNYYVRGQIKNDSSYEASIVTVQLKFKDADGAVLNSASDSIPNLAAGETWNFDMRYLHWDESKVAKLSYVY